MLSTFSAMQQTTRSAFSWSGWRSAIAPRQPWSTQEFGGVAATSVTGAVNEVPLPAAVPLFATGLGALGLLGWRRKRRAQTTTPCTGYFLTLVIDVASTVSPGQMLKWLGFLFSDRGHCGVGSVPSAQEKVPTRCRDFKVQIRALHEVRQDSELRLPRRSVRLPGAEFVSPYCIKVTPASLLIVMCETLYDRACNTRLRCLIVSRNLDRLVMKRSKMRCALARLFPANNYSSIGCPSLLHFSTV
jgi:hypothetical protein